MSLSHNNTNAQPPDSPQPPRESAPESAAQLAHELANLLDGSLRHLSIAIDTLSQDPRPAEPTSPNENANNPKLMDRLQTTDLAMRQMAVLIKAWMKSAPKPRDLFEQSQTLKQALKQVIEIHKPTAASHGIDIELQLEPTAANLPAGPVFPVAANAILNSIQAIAGTQTGGDEKQHKIIVAVRLEAGLIWLMVSDDGPGLDPCMINEQGDLIIGHTTKPDGHGLGLSLSQQVAHSLQGTLTLRPRSGGGTTLTLRFPVTSLSHKTETDTPSNHKTPQE